MSPGDEGGRCLGLTTLPHSCADFLELREPRFPGTLRASKQACNGAALRFYCFYTPRKQMAKRGGTAPRILNISVRLRY